MNTYIKFLLLFFGFLFLSFSTFLHAALDPNAIPKNVKKVIICHYPPGNVANVQQISISLDAIKAHIIDYKQTPPGHQFDEYATADGTCPLAEQKKQEVVTAVQVAVTALDTAIVTQQPEPIIEQKTSELNTAIQNAEVIVTAVDTATAEIKKENGSVYICHVAPGNGRVIAIEVNASSVDKDGIAHNIGNHGGDYAMPADGSCAVPITPTVNSDRTPDTTPLVTGTTGTTRLKEEEIFSVKINGIIYMEGSTTNPLTLTNNPNEHNQIWAVQIRDSNALVVGSTYPVEAKRGTQIGSGTVEIICPIGQTFSGGICKISCNSPKVSDSTGTLCICPTSMFTNASGNCEAKPVCQTPTPNYNAITNQCEVALPPNIPQITNIDGQTYTSPTAVETKNKQPVIIGMVGNNPLSSDTFDVKITNETQGLIASTNYTLQKPTGTDTTWKITPLQDFPLGKYNVEAIRMHNNVQTPDPSTWEMEITDNIAICENGVDKSIPITSWDGTKESKTYYLGQCVPPPPPVCKPCEDVPEVQELKPQKTVAESPYCDDGGKRSEMTASGVTVKRVTIINGTTDNGQLMSLNNAKVTYGEKGAAVGNMDISNAIIGIPVSACPVGYCLVSGIVQTVTETTDSGATGVRLTGVRLENAYIETSGDFNIYTGEFTPSDSWIGVKGGITRATDETSDNKWISTIINGVITAGNDASGAPVRGSVNSGRYNVSVTNPERVTKSRRIKGTIVDATVENATTMTSGNQTYVTAGTITAGSFEGDTIAYGTVVNAIITNSTLSSSNHCFSSGTVGNKGQLNWKEVIK